MVCFLMWTSDVSLFDLMPNLFCFYLDIDFDSNMKEMTTSSGTECNLYCLILLFRAITCKVGQIICRSLIITEAEFGKPEAEADSAFTFLRQAWILC